MTSKKRIFLHIGTPKTGTTALQSFLDRHETRLGKAGIVFPAAGRKSNQHYFLFSHNSENSEPSQIAWRELKEELQEKAWDTLIFSSERYCLYPKPDEVRRACLELEPEAEPHVVILLRRREALTSSWFRTAIKTWPRVCCSADIYLPFFLEKQRDLLNYDTLMNKWTEAFGEDCVHVISYDEVINGSNTPTAFCDVLRNSGVTLPDFSDEELALRVHETQPDIVLDLLLRTNQFNYGDFPYWSFIRALFDTAAELGVDASVTTADMIPTEAGERIMEDYLNNLGNQYLARFSSAAREIVSQPLRKKSYRVVSDSERAAIQLEMLKSMPKKLSAGLSAKIGKSLEDIVRIEVKRSELDHYKCLYKRDSKALKMRMNQEAFQRQAALKRKNAAGRAIQKAATKPGLLRKLLWR